MAKKEDMKGQVAKRGQVVKDSMKGKSKISKKVKKNVKDCGY